MKKIIFILLLSTSFYSCTKKCGECFIMEYEADGVTLKQETLLGEYCGSDSKSQAGEDATAQNISCTNCQIDCR